MDIMEEGTKCSLEMLEILLVDRRLKIDDRQVFIVEGVAPGHAHFMAKPWTEHRILKREASGHVWKRINHPVGHGSAGVFCKEWRGGGLGVRRSQDWGVQQCIYAPYAPLRLPNGKLANNAA